MGYPKWQFPNFRSFPGTRKCEESPLADLAGKTACPTNATLQTAPGLAKVLESGPRKLSQVGLGKWGRRFRLSARLRAYSFRFPKVK